MAKQGQFDLGSITGQIMGIVMREALRRADRAAEKMLLDAMSAKDRGERMDCVDALTHLDILATAAVIRTLQRDLPWFDYVEGERVPYSERVREDGHKVWFSFSRVQGIDAFLGGRPAGLYSMISLIFDGKVIAAYVRDLCTHKVYGFRPGSRVVHRITHNNKDEKLTINAAWPLSDQRLLNRGSDRSENMSLTQDLVGSDSPFRGSECVMDELPVESMTRLWNGEFGGMLQRGGVLNPWDFPLMYGISRLLGFRFFFFDGEVMMCPFEPEIVKKPTLSPPSDLLVIHESRIQELEEWLSPRRSKLRLL